MAPRGSQSAPGLRRREARAASRDRASGPCRRAPTVARRSCRGRRRRWEMASWRVLLLLRSDRRRRSRGALRRRDGTVRNPWLDTRPARARNGMAPLKWPTAPRSAESLHDQDFARAQPRVPAPRAGSRSCSSRRRTGPGPTSCRSPWHLMMEFEPPLVGCVLSARNYSFSLLMESRECVINIPTRALARRVVACGNCSGRRDKFATVGLTPEPLKVRIAAAHSRMLRESRVPGRRHADGPTLQFLRARGRPRLARPRGRAAADHSPHGLWRVHGGGRRHPVAVPDEVVRASSACGPARTAANVFAKVCTSPGRADT